MCARKKTSKKTSILCSRVTHKVARASFQDVRCLKFYNEGPLTSISRGPLGRYQCLPSIFPVNGLVIKSTNLIGSIHFDKPGELWYTHLDIQRHTIGQILLLISYG